MRERRDGRVRKLIFQHGQTLARDGLFEARIADVASALGLSHEQAKGGLIHLVKGGVLKRLREGHNSGKPTLYEIIGTIANPAPKDPDPTERRRPLWTDAAVVVLRREYAARAPYKYIRERIEAETGLVLTFRQVEGGPSHHCRDVRRSTTKWVSPDAPPPKPAVAEVPAPVVEIFVPHERVRYVPPGSFPASGFSMLGGRIR